MRDSAVHSVVTVLKITNNKYFSVYLVTATVPHLGTPEPVAHIPDQNVLAIRLLVGQWAAAVSLVVEGLVSRSR